MTAQSFDQAKATGFAETMIRALKDGAPALISSTEPRRVFFTALTDIAEGTSVKRTQTLKSCETCITKDTDISNHLEKTLEDSPASLLYTLPCMHCVTISIPQDCTELAAICDKEKTGIMLEDAGFANTEVRPPGRGLQSYYYNANLRPRC